MAHMYRLSLVLPVADVASQLQHSLLLGLGKVSEFGCFKLALNMKVCMSFLLRDLEESEAWVQLKKGTCFLSLLKMVPADSGQREGTTWNVVSTAQFRTHPVNTVDLALAWGLLLTGAV